jgi:regulator of sigma E protease
MLPHPPIWLILIAFVCALGPLVFFHELGHYLVARMFRIPAEAFSIGFGRELVGWTDKQGTRWKIACLPLGGYVRFVGDMSAAGNPADLEDLPEELRGQAFQVRPVWQRFLVVLAGPVANFILAIVIFTAFFSFVGAPLGNVVGAVKAGTPAAQSGIQPGDEILSVAGRPTPTFADLFNVTAVRPGENVVVEVQRGSSVRDVQVTLATDSLTDSYGHTFKRGMLGITPSDQVLKPMPIAKALPEAVSRTYRLTTAIVDGIGQTIRGRVSVKQIGGPVRVAQTAGAWAEMGVLPFVTLLALFSINLGFINLLPVPMLDGGHLLLYVIEAVRRRPVSAEAMDWAFRGGLALILALLMFVTVNDLGLWDRLQRLIG